jgi:RNA polymerase sigma-70 factor, ECF subfamily
VSDSDHPDSTILPRARLMDSTALAAIYDEYQPLIYRYIYWQLGDVEATRDLTADVFQRFLQALRHQTGPDRYLAAWLYRTAHNVLIDHYRRQQHRQHMPLEEDTAHTDGDMADDIDQQITADKVRSALQTISDDQRHVITLKFLQGMSNEQVALMLDKPVSAVKSLQHRALAALRRHLGAQKEMVW